MLYALQKKSVTFLGPDKGGVLLRMAQLQGTCVSIIRCWMRSLWQQLSNGSSGGISGVGGRSEDDDDVLTSSASGASPPLKSSSEISESGSSCDAQRVT